MNRCQLGEADGSEQSFAPSPTEWGVGGVGQSRNFTAVRVALLFAHWDSADYTIRPEDALNTFEKHRAEFDPLLCDVANVHENDLLSIVKYRGAGATYFVPLLADAIAAFRRHLFQRSHQLLRQFLAFP